MLFPLENITSTFAGLKSGSLFVCSGFSVTVTFWQSEIISLFVISLLEKAFTPEDLLTRVVAIAKGTENFAARVFLHEFDHMEGIDFTQRKG